MQRSLTWARAGVGAALGLLLLAQPAAADELQQVTTITIDDGGVNPGNVTMPLGGTVIWQNNGTRVHTATTQGQAPLPMDTGGIGPGQNTSMILSTPGTYYYTSETDCEGGVPSTGFNCGPWSVTVSNTPVAQAAAAPQQAAPPSAAPAPQPPLPVSNTNPLPYVTVTITPTGIVPSTVAVTVGGTVNFVNQTSGVHSATSSPGQSLPSFDTGGLGPGQVDAIAFTSPGTYSFTSAPDCLNGSVTPGFACGPYQLIVGNTAPPAPAPSGSVAQAVAPNPNTSVSIDDVNGFTPPSLTIKAGQTVTWTNKGQVVHSVVAEQVATPLGLQPVLAGLDSGGLNPGQTFGFTFNTPGTYNYHSSTEPIYTQSKFAAPVVTYQFNGTITVQP